MANKKEGIGCNVSCTEEKQVGERERWLTKEKELGVMLAVRGKSRWRRGERANKSEGIVMDVSCMGKKQAGERGRELTKAKEFGVMLAVWWKIK